MRLIECLALLILVPSLSFTQVPTPDLVVVNANVHTMKSRSDTAEAFAVTAGRITAVGGNNSIRKLVGPNTRVIDAKGRLVLPGFNDAHVHFMGIGNSFSTFDLRGLNTSEEVANQISRYVRFLPKGRWIVGSGWRDETAPKLDQIDRLAPDNPILIYRADGRSAFANSVALRAVKVKASDGIVEGGALQRVAALVPRDHTRNWIEVAETATNFAASLGVTSVQDMHSDDSRAVYRDLERVGKLKTRVYDCTPLSDWTKLYASNPSRENTAMVRGGCLKGFSDGDPTAAAKLEADIAAADKVGLQIMIHAVGNSANSIVLEAFERAIKVNGTRDRRFRVEHAHNPRVIDLPRFAKARLITSMQPHLFNGSNGGYYSRLLKSGVTIALGSDAAITDLNPLLGIHAAVNAGPESISVYEAVRAYTVGSAYAEFQEKQKGTIQAGKLADFVILSDDIFSLPADRIRGARTVLTAVDGKVVFEDQL